MKLKIISILSFIFLSSVAFAGKIIQEKNSLVAPFSISEQWIRFPAETSVNGAAYFNIQNNSSEDIKIVGVVAEDGLCREAELHGYKPDDNGVMRMFKLESITIPAKTMIEFKPGSNHLMLMGLMKKIEQNSHYKVKLKFLAANAENKTSSPYEIEINFPVK